MLYSVCILPTMFADNAVDTEVMDIHKKSSNVSLGTRGQEQTFHLCIPDVYRTSHDVKSSDSYIKNAQINVVSLLQNQIG